METKVEIHIVREKGKETRRLMVNSKPRYTETIEGNRCTHAAGALAPILDELMLLTGDKKPTTNDTAQHETLVSEGETTPGIVINLGSLVERFEATVSDACECSRSAQCREKFLSGLQERVVAALLQSVQSAAGAMQATPGESSTRDKECC